MAIQRRKASRYVLCMSTQSVLKLASNGFVADAPYYNLAWNEGSKLIKLLDFVD